MNHVGGGVSLPAKCLSPNAVSKSILAPRWRHNLHLTQCMNFLEPECREPEEELGTLWKASLPVECREPEVELGTLWKASLPFELAALLFIALTASSSGATNETAASPAELKRLSIEELMNLE